jgi:predicted metal-dependent hydrolase
MMASEFPPAFLDGVRLFNGGQYFEAHEAFEELMDHVEEDRRWDLLVALIQVSVGYHKCVSGHPGGTRMLGMGLEKLGAFADDAFGVGVGALRARVAADLAALEAGEPVSERLGAPPRITLAR